jgi:hypothetical protein
MDLVLGILPQVKCIPSLRGVHINAPVPQAPRRARVSSADLYPVVASLHHAQAPLSNRYLPDNMRLSIVTMAALVAYAAAGPVSTSGTI